MTQLINDGAVYRTAPATPGLLITEVTTEHQKGPKISTGLEESEMRPTGWTLSYIAVLFKQTTCLTTWPSVCLGSEGVSVLILAHFRLKQCSGRGSEVRQ